MSVCLFISLVSGYLGIGFLLVLLQGTGDQPYALPMALLLLGWPLLPLFALRGAIRAMREDKAAEEQAKKEKRFYE